jgi:hypothetical protein
LLYVVAIYSCIAVWMFICDVLRGVNVGHVNVAGKVILLLAT